MVSLYQTPYSLWLLWRYGVRHKDYLGIPEASQASQRQRQPAPAEVVVMVRRGPAMPLYIPLSTTSDVFWAFCACFRSTRRHTVYGVYGVYGVRHKGYLGIPEASQASPAQPSSA
jgi:hypothetical protein